MRSRPTWSDNKVIKGCSAGTHHESHRAIYDHVDMAHLLRVYVHPKSVAEVGEWNFVRSPRYLWTSLPSLETRRKMGER